MKKKSPVLIQAVTLSSVLPFCAQMQVSTTDISFISYIQGSFGEEFFQLLHVKSGSIFILVNDLGRYRILA